MSEIDEEELKNMNMTELLMLLYRRITIKDMLRLQWEMLRLQWEILRVFTGMYLYMGTVSAILWLLLYITINTKG